MQQNKILIRPILFLHYKESLVSSNVNSKQLRFHCFRPNLDASTQPKWLNQVGSLNFLESIYSSSTSFLLGYVHCTPSVLRIFVHSVSCHFFLSKIVQLNFSVKSLHSLLDSCHLTQFFSSIVCIIAFL